VSRSSSSWFVKIHLSSLICMSHLANLYAHRTYGAPDTDNPIIATVDIPESVEWRDSLYTGPECLSWAQADAIPRFFIREDLPGYGPQGPSTYYEVRPVPVSPVKV
jgi:hypothetical protein